MKFKKIPVEYFPTILDRLTRFEPAYVRYKRVFDDIINKFSIDQKLKNLTLEDEISLVEEIFNNSLNTPNDDFSLNSTLIELEKKYFITNEVSYQYLSSRINILQMLNEVQNFDSLTKNTLWLKSFQKNNNLKQNRVSQKLLFPIEKIILCEGQTEYTLLQTIFKLFDIDFDKDGILVIQAGGKNQVARKYYQMLEYVKLPFFILLDEDASEICKLINAKIRQTDILYCIKKGEFEDLIPKNILLNVINSIHSNELNCSIDDFNDEIKMAENLENIYKKYGFGEFKKARFAQQLNSYIMQNVNKNDFKDSELNQIVNSLQDF